ncbi:MAG: hypothetical protein ACK6CT_04520 [Planctomycetia bacterium]
MLPSRQSAAGALLLASCVVGIVTTAACDDVADVDPATALRLTPAQAAALAARGGELALPALAVLPADVAEALATHAGPLLDLGGLHALSAEAAEKLSHRPGRLRLGGLRRLTADVARPLARTEGWLELPALESLEPDVAEILAQRLSFGLAVGVKTLRPEVAAAIATSTNDLALPRLAELTPAVATALARHAGGTLRLDALSNLEPDVALALAGHGGFAVDLPGLKTLWPEAARGLAAMRGQLRLTGLTSLSTAAAEQLAPHGGMLWLALPEIPADTAAALARHHGDLQMRLTTLDSAALAGKLAGQESPGLGSVASLSVAAARALAGRHAGLDLSGLRRLSPEIARELAACRGVVNLTGLETISAADTAALGATRVVLDGRLLAAIDAETRATLLETEHVRFDYGRMTTLTPPIVKAIVGREANLVLSGISDFDFPDAVEVASVRAPVRGTLALPGLKSISANAVSALIRKEDIDIPLLESLQIVPEPDGSPSEDIVVPAGFAERQERRRTR